MLDHDCNILNNMSRSDFREFRSLMVEMVLHTGNWRQQTHSSSLHAVTSRHDPALLTAENDEEPHCVQCGEGQVITSGKHGFRKQ